MAGRKSFLADMSWHKKTWHKHETSNTRSQFVGREGRRAKGRITCFSFRPKLDPGGAGQERERVWDLLGRRRWRKHSPRSSFFPFAIARYTQQQCSTCLVWHSAISPSLFSAHIQSWTTVPFSCQLWLLSKHQNPRLVRRPKRRMSFGQKRIPPFPSSWKSRVTRTITTGLQLIISFYMLMNRRPNMSGFI